MNLKKDTYILWFPSVFPGEDAFDTFGIPLANMNQRFLRHSRSYHDRIHKNHGRWKMRIVISSKNPEWVWAWWMLLISPDWTTYKEAPLKECPTRINWRFLKPCWTRCSVSSWEIRARWRGSASLRDSVEGKKWIKKLTISRLLSDQSTRKK